MKQQITSLQLKELSEKSYKKLFKWMDDHGYVSRSSTSYPQSWDEKLKGETESVYMPEPTIGQMIEFLDEQYSKGNKFSLSIERTNDGWCLWETENEDGELCEALWKSCVEIL